MPRRDPKNYGSHGSALPSAGCLALLYERNELPFRCKRLGVFACLKQLLRPLPQARPVPHRTAPAPGLRRPSRQPAEPLPNKNASPNRNTLIAAPSHAGVRPVLPEAGIKVRLTPLRKPAKRNVVPGSQTPESDTVPTGHQRMTKLVTRLHGRPVAQRARFRTSHPTGHADWVILSACNTAASAATSAEALSGLAQGTHLCTGAVAVRLTLGGLLECDGQADHSDRPRERDGPRSKGRPRGGTATLDAGAYRQRRTARGPPGLLGTIRGSGRQCQVVVDLPVTVLPNRHELWRASLQACVAAGGECRRSYGGDGARRFSLAAASSQPFCSAANIALARCGSRWPCGHTPRRSQDASAFVLEFVHRPTIPTAPLVQRRTQSVRKPF